MYNYNDLFQKLHIENNKLNRFYLKTIINALINNNEAIIEKQKIYVDFSKVEYLWNLLIKLSEYFDYKYNTKYDLTKFLTYILNGNKLSFNAIFCPGYTDNGYKDYIGKNNSKRIEYLRKLKDKLQEEKINAEFKISLADIFLENTNSIINPNWYDELIIHVKKFVDTANKNFSKEEIVIFSKIFKDIKYIRGFIDQSFLHGKNYDNFYKNNQSFYRKMNWSIEEIKERNDRLYTIYTIISKYIYSQVNGIYMPMETMYSRSKVMTNNNVCSMYLYK